MQELDSYMTEQPINTKKMYWIFQLVGWSLFFVFYAGVAAYFNDYQWQIIVGYLNTVIVGFLLTHLYRGYIKRYSWEKIGIFKLSGRVVLASIIVGTIWSAIVLPINNTFFKVESDQEFTFGIGVIIVLNLSIVAAGWSIMYFLFKFFINLKSSEIEKWRLEAAVKDAELIALKSQINPHFLFNCLNNIRSLVIENPEKSRDMIGHLSDLLRYSVQFNNREKVSIEQELDVVQNYLNLESIQFEDRLKYTLEIKPETLDLKVPPMAIQLLVENAIKHGISNLPAGGEINIKSYLSEDNLIVEVINSGQINTEKKGTGIGLKNASDRLRLLFGKISNLEINNLNEHQVKASFKIPLI
ncbi:MAG: histidine kinase [Fulvivirga sp.]|uniref:sensor histidine kinase n=1 Tax=Fulvivirga sp. TaxID=1931237 RepID=UPI0032EFB382